MAQEILVVGSFFDNVYDNLGKQFSLIRANSRDALDRLDNAALENVEGMACFGWAPAGVMDRLPNLKMISSFGVGYDGVDVDHAVSKNIVVSHTPDVLNDDVANTAIALTLMTTRQLVAQDRYLREGRWAREGAAPLTTSIRGKTVGIVGLGRIGQAIADKLAVFRCDIAYHSRNEKPDVPHRYYEDLTGMAADCDVLVVITPGGPATHRLINRTVIDALGPKGTLINVARGSVVDEGELVSALLEGRLGGAGLDVFEDEPNVPDALIAMDNVVLTPHVASATRETRQDMADLVVENLFAFFRDGAAATPVPECRHLQEG